jgi:endoglucanase
LPGEVGFTGEGRRVVNLSYWIFPALRDIAAATGDPIWNRLIATGHRLVERARFGARQLPSDWLETNGDLRPAESFPPRFGYDAVRVPLNLVWGGMATADRLEPIARAWSSFGREVPAWIDVMTDQVSPEFQSPGMQAVARLTLAAAQGRRLSDADLPSLDAAQDYYAASLLMQCYLAATEMDAGHVS